MHDDLDHHERPPHGHLLRPGLEEGEPRCNSQDQIGKCVIERVGSYLIADGPSAGNDAITSNPGT